MTVYYLAGLAVVAGFTILGFIFLLPKKKKN